MTFWAYQCLRRRPLPSEEGIDNADGSIMASTVINREGRAKRVACPEAGWAKAIHDLYVPGTLTIVERIWRVIAPSGVSPSIMTVYLSPSSSNVPTVKAP